MESSNNVNVVKDGNGEEMNPNDFWDLVETLLKRTASDYGNRARDNNALSVVCRGHAVSRKPRLRVTTGQTGALTAKPKDLQKKQLVPPLVVRTAKQITKIKKSGEKGRKKNMKRPPSRQNRKEEVEEVEVTVTPEERCKSACRVVDLDVVFVKGDENAPAAEKLWRYAIKNRMDVDGQTPEVKGREVAEPGVTKYSLRNEAIYEGLKQLDKDAKDAAVADAKTEVKDVSPKTSPPVTLLPQAPLGPVTPAISVSPSGPVTPAAPTPVAPAGVPTPRVKVSKAVHKERKSKSQGECHLPIVKYYSDEEMLKMRDERRCNTEAGNRNEIMKRNVNLPAMLSSDRGGDSTYQSMTKKLDDMIRTELHHLQEEPEMPTTNHQHQLMQDVEIKLTRKSVSFETLEPRSKKGQQTKNTQETVIDMTGRQSASPVEHKSTMRVKQEMLEEATKLMKYQAMLRQTYSPESNGEHPGYNTPCSSQHNYRPDQHYSHDNFQNTARLYNCVQKRRMTCGTQLENLNRQIVDKKLNPRTTLSCETTQQYIKLKSEYLKLCYQESSLRHDIVMLQAEIFMLQNKAYHKRPINVNTVTLDANAANLPKKNRQDPTLDNTSLIPSDLEDDDDVFQFKRYRAPRPLVCTLQQKLNSTKQMAKKIIEKKIKGFDMGINGENLPFLPNRGRDPSIDSLYSMSSQSVPGRSFPSLSSLGCLPRMASYS